MSINSYQVFVTVTEQGSFLKASSILNITPSAISHSIASLENDFGYPLLVRSKSGVVLTSYGESVMPYIRLVLQSEVNLRQQVDALNGIERGIVRLGCFNSICNTHVPTLIDLFHKLYPGIKIQIFQGTYTDVIGWLKNGIVDIGFLSKASAGNEIPIYPLYEDELFCIAPEGYKVVNKDYITHEEIKNMEFIAQQDSTDSDIDNYLDKYQLQVKTSCYVSDDLAAVSLVSNGFGICIMPKLVLNSIKNYPVAMYSLSPKGYRTIGICCYKDNLSPAANKMYEFIVRSYQEKHI
jgi:DNA-binding transcriptional LysR family regulator